MELIFNSNLSIIIFGVHIMKVRFIKGLYNPFLLDYISNRKQGQASPTPTSTFVLKEAVPIILMDDVWF